MKLCTFLLCIPGFWALVAGCNQGEAGSTGANGSKTASPPGYSLHKPDDIRKLPSKMDEVSGLSFYPKDSSLFAVIDEAGMLFKVFIDNKKDEQWEFGEKSDYEDLVLVDSTFWALTSKGKLVSFTFEGNTTSKLQEYEAPVDGKNEFEILYRSGDNILTMICKDCEGDTKTFTTAYEFDLSNKKFRPATIKLAVDAIADQLQEKDKAKFKPSAAAKHPRTDEVFIVSSVNKALVIADSGLKVKAVYKLDAELYKQPEGIAFAPNGDMFISNESADEGSANILIFKYKRQN